MVVEVQHQGPMRFWQRLAGFKQVQRSGISVCTGVDEPTLCNGKISKRNNCFHLQNGRFGCQSMDSQLADFQATNCVSLEQKTNWPDRVHFDRCKNSFKNNFYLALKLFTVLPKLQSNLPSKTVFAPSTFS